MLTVAGVVNLVRLQVHHTDKRQLVLVRGNITYIPTDIRLCSTLPTFKRHLKTYLFKSHLHFTPAILLA